MNWTALENGKPDGKGNYLVECKETKKEKNMSEVIIGAIIGTAIGFLVLQGILRICEKINKEKKNEQKENN